MNLHGMYTHSFSTDLHDQDRWRSSNRDASTSNFPSKAASSVVHSWHKAGGKPAIVDNNSA